MRSIRHISRRPDPWPCGHHLLCESVASFAEPACRERRGHPGDRLVSQQSGMGRRGSGGELRGTTFRARSRRMRGRSQKSRQGIHLSAGMREDEVGHNLLDQQYQIILECRAHRRSCFIKPRSVKLKEVSVVLDPTFGQKNRARNILYASQSE